jgi:hypothetical protein
MAKVDFQGDLPLTNPLLLSKQLDIEQNAYYGFSLLDHYRLESLDNVDVIKPGQEAHYVTVTGALDGFVPNGAVLTKAFGAEVCTVSSTFDLRYSDSSQYFTVDKSKILHVAPAAGNTSAPEVPVFL